MHVTVHHLAYAFMISVVVAILSRHTSGLRNWDVGSLGTATKRVFIPRSQT